MGANIKCPNCGHAIDVEGAITVELEQHLQKEYDSKFQQSLKNFEQKRIALREEQRLFEEKKQKENELFAQKVIKEKQKMEAEIAEKLRKSISSDFENQLRILEENNKDNEEKLKLSRHKELEFLQKEQMLQNKEAEIEISIQRKLQEERIKLSEEIRKLEEQKTANKENEYLLRLRELEKQLE